MQYSARDPDFEARVRGSFVRQGLMATLGARLELVAPGAVDIRLRSRPEISQQHGFIHGGAIGAIADSAAGYAALTLTEPGLEVLTTEYKINFAAPANGSEIVAQGRVIRSGRTLILVKAEVFSGDRLVAFVTATMMAMNASG
ncbi:uncharacterized protein (TIGR00369 family) [Camelimonas lactis]|uniref:Uncharacterized protein (TIGR00369 family) n=2 Tax=Camelimonas lactis TaxID=659006 RepID=A0A4R2GU36_9HYPH|nr:uncharacterized protein (TIGR00369 family) [Camelimonas lactis]